MSAFGTPVISSHIIAFTGGVTTVAATANTSATDLIVVGCFGPSSAGSVTDTIGNTYTKLPTDGVSGGNSFHAEMYYCLSSSGSNASNVVTWNNGNNNAMGIIVWNVPITSATLTQDAAAHNASTGFNASPLTSTSFSTTGTDEAVFVVAGCDLNNAINFTAGTGYTLDANIHNASSDSMGGEHQIFSSTQSGITATIAMSASAFSAMNVIAIKAVPAAGGAVMPVIIIMEG
jgi:hypothetical protein